MAKIGLRRLAVYANRGRRRTAASVAVLLTAAGTVSLFAQGRKVVIQRKFSPGASIAYKTHTRTESRVETEPKGLDAFLPPIPSELTTDQENTLTVQNVRPDGEAEVESRFDRFEIKSSLPDSLTEANREAILASQQDFSKSLTGRSLSLHYDRQGRLTDIGGTDEMLKDVPAPFRDPLLQAFKYLVQQISGNGLYPDQPVSPGEEWQRKLEPLLSGGFPFDEEGTSRLRFVGQTHQGGVQAAVIAYNFNDVLTPRMEELRATTPLAALEAQGMKLDVEIKGQGQGRAALALEDGRILENHATLRQVLTAHLKPAPSSGQPPADPITIRLTTDTTLDVEGKDPNR